MIRHLRGGRGLSVLVLSVVLLAGAALLVSAAFNDTLTYYRTPSEVVEEPSADQVRLGGLVVEGSVSREGGQVRFDLTDGETDLTVSSPEAPPDTFREGQGAVVEGRLDEDGVFRATRIIVRHSNEYQPAEVLDR